VSQAVVLCVKALGDEGLATLVTAVEASSVGHKRRQSDFNRSWNRLMHKPRP
jgi:hypothetical protein